MDGDRGLLERVSRNLRQRLDMEDWCDDEIAAYREYFE